VGQTLGGGTVGVARRARERATPPFCIERLLEGALLARPRSSLRAVVESGDQDERPLRGSRDQLGAGQRLVAAAPRPAARRPSGDNCDSDTNSPHRHCHATMVRNSHRIDKNFVEIMANTANHRQARRSVRECL